MGLRKQGFFAISGFSVFNGFFFVENFFFNIVSENLHYSRLLISRCQREIKININLSIHPLIHHPPKEEKK